MSPERTVTPSARFGSEQMFRPDAEPRLEPITADDRRNVEQHTA